MNAISTLQLIVESIDKSQRGKKALAIF